MTLLHLIDQYHSQILMGEVLPNKLWNGKNSSRQGNLPTIPSIFSHKQTNKYLVL